MRRALTESFTKKIGTLVPLPDLEAKHLVSVLRLGPEDEVQILDGSGFEAKAKLVFREKKVFAEIIDEPTTTAARCSLPLHLYLSVLKGDAMEWVVEKATELGVRTLTPVETEFTVVKVQKRGADTFQDRWQRIADQSLKQCERLDRMMVNSPISFETMLQNPHHLFWLDEAVARESSASIHLAALQNEIKTTRDFSLLVGPEGGFSAAERNRLLQLTGSEKHEITRAGLGSLILRAETAAIHGISLMIGNHYGKRKN